MDSYTKAGLDDLNPAPDDIQPETVSYHFGRVGH